MELVPCYLVILDISGYTRFTKYHATSVLHAEEIISALLEAILDSAEYPLTIAKLEGDAVFLYATIPAGAEADAAARDIAAQTGKMFRSFYAKERALLDCRHGCVCEACKNIGQLRVKAVLHAGDVAFKQIREFKELAGRDVIFAHRLLKNTIPVDEYVLLSTPFHAHSGDIAGQPPERRTEQVEDFGAHEVLVYYPASASNSEEVPPVKGTQLAGRLNRHSFARMFGLKPRDDYRHLPVPHMNLILYLLEGINSGVNVLRQQFARR